jgi:hypothetical protein
MDEQKNPADTTTNTEQPPLPACPKCGMIKNEWPGEGYTHEGQIFCCQGCAEGTGCTCLLVSAPGFSREGQKATRAKPRPGEQKAGASAPKGELSGERDSNLTEEAIDQSGNSTVFSEPAPLADKKPNAEQR